MATLERLNGGVDSTGRVHSAGRTVAVWAAVAALLAALGGGFWWWTHPTVLTPGSASEKTIKPLPVAKAAMSATVLFPRARGQVSSITLDKVTPIFADNSAQATVTFSICHMSPGEVPLGMGPDPARECSDLVPLHPGATFDYGVQPDTDYLIMTLTPTQPGVVHVTGEDVTYSTGPDHLFRHGTQRMGMDVEVTARSANAAREHPIRTTPP